jgi:L-Ala-D/L-Glu epimerase
MANAGPNSFIPTRSFASNNVIEGLECAGPLKTSDDIVTDRLDISSGLISVPGGKGLGLDLDEAKVRQYQFAF